MSLVRVSAVRSKKYKHVAHTCPGAENPASAAPYIPGSGSDRGVAQRITGGERRGARTSVRDASVHATVAANRLMVMPWRPRISNRLLRGNGGMVEEVTGTRVPVVGLLPRRCTVCNMFSMFSRVRTVLIRTRAPFCKDLHTALPSPFAATAIHVTPYNFVAATP